MTTSSTVPYLWDDAELVVICGVLVELELAPPAAEAVAPPVLPLPLELPVAVAFPDEGESPAGTVDVEMLAVVVEFGAEAVEVVPELTVEAESVAEAVVEEAADEEPADELGLEDELDEPHEAPSLDDLMLSNDPVMSEYV